MTLQTTKNNLISKRVRNEHGVCAAIRSTPIMANGVLFVMSERSLIAVKAK
jgi:hypothetical protein